MGGLPAPESRLHIANACSAEPLSRCRGRCDGGGVCHGYWEGLDRVRRYLLREGEGSRPGVTVVFLRKRRAVNSVYVNVLLFINGETPSSAKTPPIQENPRAEHIRVRLCLLGCESDLLQSPYIAYCTLVGNSCGVGQLNTNLTAKGNARHLMI